MKRHLAIGLASILWAVNAAPQVAADEYPSRPIRILSPVPAGGLSDIAMRPMVQELSKALGQPVIIENKPGAGGLLMGRACAQAAPDGYTICNIFNDVISNAPFMFKNVGYDPYKDFAPITNVYYITAGFLVKPSLDVKNLNELIALSKSKPEGINYGSPATGTIMFMENFNKSTGSNFVTIPYKSGSEVANALLTNSVQVGVLGIGNLVPHLQAGTFKGMAVDSTERSPLIPDVPTLKELGYAQLRIKSWYGFAAPAGTPPAIIKTLHDQIVKIYNDHAMKQNSLIQAGLEPILDTPEEFTRYLAEDRVRTAEQAKRVGIKPQ